MNSDLVIRNRRAFDNWKVASGLRRSLSFSIDCFIIFTLLYIISSLLPQPFSIKSAIVFFVLTFWLWDGFWLSFFGWTPGNKALGLQVFSPRIKGAPHPLQVTLRVLIFWLTFPLMGLCVTSILFRRDRRGWHDLISETLVLGPEKSSPSAYISSLGHNLVLFQALIVFSTLGSFLFSTAVKIIENDKHITSSNCSQPAILLENPQLTNKAILISPAWSACWEKLESHLENISDSKVYKFATLANVYHHLSSLPPKERNQIHNKISMKMEKQLCNNSSKNYLCQIKDTFSKPLQNRSIASTENNLEQLFLNLSKNKSPQNRIKELRNFKKQTSLVFLQSAINDRIWSEQLALGIMPENKPTSVNFQWNKDQLCWAQLITTENLGACAQSSLPELFSKLTEMENSNYNEDQTEELLDWYREQNSHKDFIKLTEIWQHVRSKNSQGYNKSMAQLSQLSPLRSIASHWKKYLD